MGWTSRPGSPELDGERRRYTRERGGDHYRVEGGVSRGSFGSIPRQDHDIVDALRGEVALRLRCQVRPDVDADHVGGEPGQQRGLVAVAGADLEYLFCAGQAERRDHRGRQGRLGGHLMVRDRYGPVIVGSPDVGGRHKRCSWCAPDRIQHARISDADGPGRRN